MSDARPAAPVAPGTDAARAVLRDASGRQSGQVIADRTAAGIALTISVSGLSAGPRGVHVHAVGRCDAPDFQTAGGHWNPASSEHGRLNPRGPHAGDLPNLEVGADGNGTLRAVLEGADMTGANGLLDSDGAAFIVHAGPDDLMTDPSGNSGPRVLCGVFAPR